MTMPFSGQISLGDARTELSADYAPTSQITLNDTAVRTLFERSVAGTNIGLADGYGKSNRKSLPVIFTTNHTNFTINMSSLSGYIAGKTDVTVTINSGVYVYSTSTSSAALTISGGTAGDTVTIINNGYIMGMGGNGGSNRPGFPGGTAINLGVNATINNTNASAYIGGGGGGGGSGGAQLGISGGGGGAGGGNGGTGAVASNFLYPGGSGGAVGASGSAGTTGTAQVATAGGGGGGGAGGGGGSSAGGVDFGSMARIPVGGGGGGGGRVFTGSSGAGGTVIQEFYGGTNGGSGGAGNANGGDSLGVGAAAGGGGGWGARGGASPYYGYTGGNGGKAVNLNGKSITWVSNDTTRVYGSVS
jgi:hypothetical protein